MQSIRDRVSALTQWDRARKLSIREQIARGTVSYESAAELYRGLASSGTIRKWRRTHEAVEAGWVS